MIKTLVKKSRSKRSFRPSVEISREALSELVDTARYCPAAMNLQVLKYRLVTDKDELSRMLGITRWASSLSIKLPPENHEPSAFIVICHDTDIAPIKPIFSIDVGICAQTIMLAAAEAGLGGCIIGSASPETVADTLNIPSNLTPQLILGLGIPDETVELVEAKNGKVKYYRDENNIHYVPKRPLDEIIF